MTHIDMNGPVITEESFQKLRTDLNHFDIFDMVIECPKDNGDIRYVMFFNHKNNIFITDCTIQYSCKIDPRPFQEKLTEAAREAISSKIEIIERDIFSICSGSIIDTSKCVKNLESFIHNELWSYSYTGYFKKVNELMTILNVSNMANNAFRGESSVLEVYKHIMSFYGVSQDKLVKFVKGEVWDWIENS